ncbi:hypothetical protein SAMN02746041_01420 [Desulfacinum hydrothermale DSM 13146]|uniref:Uncharacterized protein n=2 Tax=Desulfacinum hydrothermale TaxID=109258 RepID=A0A1W1XEC4_9BACT|nr:hypothetical protein SAMN02746041_01420 [Desulfacinum hydrothermale DSM 13146]
MREARQIRVKAPMETNEKSTTKASGSLAALFDDLERKELFRKYLIFLGWLEVAIFAGCWIYQLGTRGYDRFGPVEIPFPWKAYFLVAFLAPVAVTFLIGTIIVGFNLYLGGHTPEKVDGAETRTESGDGEPRPGTHRVAAAVDWLQKLPYLGLLVVLAAGIGLVYKLDVVLDIVGRVGERTVQIVLLAGGAILGLAALFALVYLVLNYKLRKRSMEYQYKSEVAERYGLVILEDNTVINRDGKLLVRGRKWKDAVPLLEAQTSPPPTASNRESLPPTPSPDLNS